MGNKALKTNQKGLVSFTVVIVIMIVVTLLVTSFALVVRREQRRSLDRQLSMQAFYAAETGLREAQQVLLSGTLLQDLGGISECTGENSFISKVNEQITEFNDPMVKDYIDNKLSENTEYTCVLINPAPLNWEHTAIEPNGDPLVVPISTQNNIDSIRIGWQAKDGTTSFDTPTGKLPQNASLNSPLLRVTLMPTFESSGSYASDINNKSHTMFLYPNPHPNQNLIQDIPYLDNGSSWVDVNNRMQGAFVNGNCNSSKASVIDDKPVNRYCNVDIKNLSGNNYMLIIQPLYKAVSVDLQAFDGNDAQQLKESQAVVDVTGRSADVIRRINVRVPMGKGYKYRNLSGNNLIPKGAIETTEDICKWLKRTNTQVENVCTGGDTVQLSSVMNGGSVWGDANVEDAPPSGTYTTNPANYYAYSFNVYNRSSVSPGTLESCTWDWGDGVVQVLDDSHPWCQNDAMAGHSYPDTRGLINRTYGTEGCYKYTLKLTNTFTAASGLLPAEDTMTMYPPRGIANDPPNPTTGVGICNGRYKNAPAPPVPADTTPSDPPACYLVFPVTPVIGGKGPNPCP